MPFLCFNSHITVGCPRFRRLPHPSVFEGWDPTSTDRLGFSFGRWVGHISAESIARALPLNADTKKPGGAPLLAIFEKWPIRAARRMRLCPHAAGSRIFILRTSCSFENQIYCIAVSSLTKGIQAGNFDKHCTYNRACTMRKPSDRLTPCALSP
jgi:hypothetical protein